MSLNSGLVYLHAAPKDVKEEKIFGVIFFDQNKNRIKDKFEFGIPGVTIYLDTKDDKLPIITDLDGYFEYSLTRFAYNKMKGQGELKIEEHTLPLGGFPLNVENVIKGVGKHNIPIYYESRIYDLFSKGDTKRKLRYKVDVYDSTRRTLFRGDLKNQKLYIGKHRIPLPRAQITVPETVDLANEPISATFKFKGQKKRIKKRYLIVKNSRGKIVKKRSFKGKINKYEMKAKLKQGKYYIQGKFLFSDGSVLYSNLNKFYIIKKEKMVYILKPKSGNYSFPFDVELGSFQYMINEGKNSRSLIVINYAKDNKNKKIEDEGVIGEDTPIEDAKTESVQEENAIDGESTEVGEVGNDFYARVLRKYMISHGMKPENILIKEDPTYSGENLKVLLYDLRRRELEIKPFVRVNKKRLKFDQDNMFDDRVTPKVRFKVDLMFVNGGRVVMSVMNPFMKTPSGFFEDERLSYSKSKIYWERARVSYSAVLKQGYRMFIDEKEIPVDESSRAFTIPLLIDEGENFVDIKLKPLKGKKEIKLVKVFRVTTKGTYLNVVAPRALKDKFEDDKPEFIRIVTKNKFRLKLNGREKKLEEGAVSLLYDFSRGDNVLEFSLIGRKKKINKTLIIHIDDIEGPQRVLFDLYGGYSLLNLTFDGSSPVSFKGNSKFFGARVGFIPLAFTALRNNRFCRNLVMDFNFDIGSGSIISDDISVDVKTTNIGYSMYQYFSVYSADESDLESSLRKVELSPIFKYERFNMTFSDTLLLTGISYSALKLGLLSKYVYNDSNIELGFKYSLLGSTFKTNPESIADGATSTVYDLNLKYNYAFSNTFTMSLEGRLDHLGATYTGDNGITMNSKSAVLSFKWLFE